MLYAYLFSVVTSYMRPINPKSVSNQKHVTIFFKRTEQTMQCLIHEDDNDDTRHGFPSQSLLVAHSREVYEADTCCTSGPSFGAATVTL